MVNVVGQIIHLILWLFLVLLFVRFIVDWVQVFARSWTPKGPVLVMLEAVYSVTDPPILFFRRFMPPLRLGNVALDLSFMVVIIIVYLMLKLNDVFLLS